MVVFDGSNSMLNRRRVHAVAQFLCPLFTKADTVFLGPMLLALPQSLLQLCGNVAMLLIGLKGKQNLQLISLSN